MIGQGRRDGLETDCASSWASDVTRKALPFMVIRLQTIWSALTIHSRSLASSPPFIRISDSALASVYSNSVIKAAVAPKRRVLIYFYFFKQQLLLPIISRCSENVMEVRQSRHSKGH